MKSTKATRAKEKKKLAILTSGGQTSSRPPLPGHQLSLVKKESQLIAKDPKRFLDNYALGKVVSRMTDVSAMDVDALLGGGINQLAFEESDANDEWGRRRIIPKSDKELEEKIKEFDNKYQLSKNRTLLLSMSVLSQDPSRSGARGLFGRNFMSKISSETDEGVPSTRSTSEQEQDNWLTNNNSSDRRRYLGRSAGSPLMTDEGNSDESDLEFDDDTRMPTKMELLTNRVTHRRHLKGILDSDEESGYYDANLDKSSPTAVEIAMQGFIDRIRHQDIDNIIVWVNTLASMKDVQLPFGFPHNLAIPLDPETIKDSDLRSFAESATDDFVLLDGEYSAKMEEITKRLRENWDSLQSSRWTPRDSALLFYIVTALEDGVTPALGEIRVELLRRMFPGVAEEQMTLQKYRLRTKRVWEEKRGAILKDWVRDKDDLTKKVNEGWAMLQKDLTKRLELAKEHRDQIDRTTFWRERLDKLRAEKCARIRRIQVAVEPFEKVVEEKTRLRLEEEERVKKAQRIQLMKFKESQRLKSEQEWRERAKIEMEQEHKKKMQAKQNQGRVAHRHHVLEQKRDAMKEQEKARMEKDKERKMLLEKTKIPVNLTEYPVGNLLADTYSSLLHRRDIVTYDEEEDEMVAFFRSRYNNSFSSEKVLRDRRNRVENKLREAGLLGNDYARQVLLAMEPKPKPHLLSNIQFKEDGN